MNSVDEIMRALGPIPVGPAVDGRPLDGDGVISVVDPATGTPRRRRPSGLSAARAGSASGQRTSASPLRAVDRQALGRPFGEPVLET
jgi:hypothetical protein